ncbi:MAG: riboflavin kinase [Candidatus Peregrinibacteria bacterium]
METISGKIISGKGLGKKLGFPTLNIECDCERGVYVGRVFLDREYKAAVHVGDGVLEAYLLDFEGSVGIGAEMKVELLEKARDSEKISDFGELKKVIGEDVAFVKNWYTLHHDN